MLILYTTLRCSTTREVITTALYSKHWSHLPALCLRDVCSAITYARHKPVGAQKLQTKDKCNVANVMGYMYIVQSFWVTKNYDFNFEVT